MKNTKTKHFIITSANQFVQAPDSWLVPGAHLYVSVFLRVGAYVTMIADIHSLKVDIVKTQSQYVAGYM